MFVNPDPYKHATQKWMDVRRECCQFLGVRPNKAKTPRKGHTFWLRWTVNDQTTKDHFNILADRLEELGYPRPEIVYNDFGEFRHFAYLTWLE